MGCCQSLDIEPTPRKLSRETNSNQASVKSSDFPLEQFEINEVFQKITQNVKNVSQPAHMVPVLCLQPNAYPIVLANLQDLDSQPTGIQFPVVAISQYGRGKVVCLSQIYFLVSKAIREADTKQLLINIFHWVCGDHRSLNTILATGFKPSAAKVILEKLHEFGYFPEIGSNHMNYNSYSCLILPTDYNFNKNEASIIENSVQNGLGLIVFSTVSEPMKYFQMNQLLIKFGLSFPLCQINESYDPYNHIKISSNYEEVSSSHFLFTIDHLKTLLQKDTINTNELDDIVTALRYYLMVCGEPQISKMQEIASIVWDYLIKTNYSTEEGICPQLSQSIAIILLQDIYAKLPLSYLPEIKEHSQFPGETGPTELQDFDMSFNLVPNTWHSTGLWLPANTNAIVEITSIVPELQIQIGSHNQSLISKDGPWKRWPSVLSSFVIDSKTKTISSPFGGIVYVVTPNSEEFSSKTVHIKFKGFTKYPRMVLTPGNENIWEETKDYPTPWGEFEIPEMIFTVPTNVLMTLQNPSEAGSKFSEICQGIIKFMGYKQTRPYRIVFDIELTEEGEGDDGYPLNLDMKNIPKFFEEYNTPNIYLFQMAQLLGIISLKEGCFDEKTEEALATVATASVFQNIYESFNPYEFRELKIPILFHELWDIQTKFDHELISKALSHIQSELFKGSGIPEDIWVSFVRELCTLGNRDFTPLLERAKAIPKNILYSIRNLQPYLPQEII